MKKDFCFASKNVASISTVCSDSAVADAIRNSDYIRNETISRLLKIPSYNCKSLYWKNRYYDVIRNKVIKEMEA